LIPDILKEHSTFIFKGQGSLGLFDPGLLTLKDEISIFLQNIRNQ